MQSTAHNERGSATLEFAALAAAVGALLALVAGSFDGHGRRLGTEVGSTVVALVRGDASSDGDPTAGARAPAVDALQLAGMAGVRLPFIGERAGLQRRSTNRRIAWGDGSDLQLRPLVPSRRLWHRQKAWTFSHGPGRDARVEVDGCAMCAEAGWRGSWGATQRADGVAAEGLFDASAALVSGQVQSRARRRLLGAQLQTQSRASGNVGLSAGAKARARLSRREQHLDLGGSAVAGAAIRAEHRTAVEHAGLALRHTAGVEGWAGAGARARAKVKRKGAQLSWAFSFGGALGWGGEVDTEGSVEVRDVKRARRWLGRMARAGVVMSNPSIAPVAALAWRSP